MKLALLAILGLLVVGVYSANAGSCYTNCTTYGNTRNCVTNCY